MSDVAFNSAGTVPQTTAERRRGARQLTLMRVGVVHAPQGPEFCLVRNLSAGGLMASVYRTFRQDEEVRVELTTGHILAGDVVWTRGCDIGVKFRASIDVGGVLSSRWGPETDMRPRAPRLDLRCPATARFGARSVSVRLGNISQRGARILSPEPVPKLASVVLGLPDIPIIHGIVRWSSGEEAGLSFNESLSFSVLARWVEERRQIERDTAGGQSLSPAADRTDR